MLQPEAPYHIRIGNGNINLPNGSRRAAKEHHPQDHMGGGMTPPLREAGQWPEGVRYLCLQLQLLEAAAICIRHGLHFIFKGLCCGK